MIVSSNSLVDLALSVSSILKMNAPLFLRAQSQLNKAVWAPPICSAPVGLGANLTRTFSSMDFTLSECFCAFEMFHV
jgi:hypothetical protein